MAKTITVTERLAKTEDGRIVPESHPDARWLFAVPGDEIPAKVAREAGLTKGSKDEPEAKEAEPADNKARSKPATKSKKKKGQ